jgi:hypothetical protein
MQRARIYNYVDFLAKSNPAILTDSQYFRSFYMWGKGNARAIYDNGTGASVLDTINLCSFGSVLHPFWAGYNTSVPHGTLVLDSTHAYMVDSIACSGYYGRNPAKPGIVDTLRVTVMEASEDALSPIRIWSSTGNMANYGVDTVRAFNPYYDIVRRTMYKPAGSTGAVWSADLALRSFDTGSRSFAVAPYMNISKGHYVVATFTFISGEEVTFPTGDTVFRGPASVAAPFKYGMFRPYAYVEKVSGASPAFPTYMPSNYNAGLFKENPDTATQATAHYTANFFWNAPGGGAPEYQYPDVDWKVSCLTCYFMDAHANASAPGIGSPFPNPAHDKVTIPIIMSEASEVSVSLSNVMGQVVAVHKPGRLAAGQLKNITLNTEALAEGLYVLTIVAENAQQSLPVSVIH